MRASTLVHEVHQQLVCVFRVHLLEVDALRPELPKQWMLVDADSLADQHNTQPGQW